MPDTTERLHHVEEAMGTVFSFDVRGGGLDDALSAAVASLHQADTVFSTYRPESQVSRLARGELTLAACDPDIREVLRRCEEAEQRSRGWFSARYAGPLDPTGLVKGWAVERAARMLYAAGAEGVCLNGGGDIQLLGGPWRVGIADPLRPGQLAAVVAADDDLAVATSGPAERGCHILAPGTGLPPETSLASLTVLCRSLTEADAWATAGYAMGDAARDWLEELPDTEAFAVTSDGGLWHTTGFARHAVGIRA
ncbi:FAD:protein FMN transferase [Streptacidiphilus griseoplanus]|uniref:FAD:protein FMN transferase n=1 Tax=Peterkaempfera griseoplana TaxID=66896 RepID=UPI000A60880D|nr:FAD:protein FMN transferase [Peterkaempfera griseoplana]